MAGRQDIPLLQERVAKAKKELEALKRVPQPISGDSWLFYRGETEDDWDLDFDGITGTTWERLYKLTMNVDDPSRGFATMFYNSDDNYTVNMSGSIEPVYDDPYSHWVKVKHADYTSAAGRLRIKFYLFATQKGTISLDLISSTP